MKPFTFRGQLILGLRRRQADLARVAVVRANESVRESVTRLAEAETRCAGAADDLRDALGDPIDAPTIVRHWNWIDRGHAYAAACRGERDQRQREADAAVAVLQQAMRQVKVMERLRDRAERRYRDAERRHEAKALDELAAQRFAQRQRAGGRTVGS